MQAIKVREFGLPAVLRLEEAANPQPGAGEILVKIEAVGVNPVETYIRSGAYAAKPDLPYTPGSDGAGTVKATGPAVGKFKIGDRVYLSGSLTGTYAELALCRETQAHPLWAGLSFAQGAAIGVPYPTAWRALFRKARAQKGETLFVHGGSGGVGIAAIQIARAAGLRVIASAGSAAGLKLIEEQGAIALDHSAAGYLDQLARLAGGSGPDVILEMLANVNLAQDLERIAPRGRIVVIGSRGKVEIDPRLFMARECEVTGMMLFNAQPEDLAAAHAGLAEGLSSGALRPVIGREFPLAEAAAAHEAVMTGGHSGKIVLVP
jgi:NADPH2:quinone reductase